MRIAYIAAGAAGVDAVGERIDGVAHRRCCVEVQVLPAAAGEDREGVREFAELLLEPGEGQVSAAVGVNVDDEQIFLVRYLARTNAPIGFRVSLSPTLDLLRVKRGILQAILGPRVLPWTVALARMTTAAELLATRVYDAVNGKDWPTSGHITKCNC